MTEDSWELRNCALKSEEIGFEDILGKVNDFNRFEDVANCLCTSKYTVLILVGFWLMFGVEIWELFVDYWKLMNFKLREVLLRRPILLRL